MHRQLQSSRAWNPSAHFPRTLLPPSVKHATYNRLSLSNTGLTTASNSNSLPSHTMPRRTRTAVAAGAAAAALLLSAQLPSAGARQTIDANDAAHVTWMGRPFPGKRTGAVGFQWLASGARVAHNGTTLRALTMATARAYKLSFSQRVVGGTYVPMQGATWVVPSDSESDGVVIAAGAGEAVVNLNMPPQYFADQVGDAGIVSFTTDGFFLPAPPRSPRVLQFIGDSITAATNVVGGIAPGGCADDGYASSWMQSWSGILCNYFDADCTTVAVGGKGLVRNCCDDGPKMPDFYVRQKYTDTGATFDFSKDRVPDAVLVYLCVATKEGESGRDS
jgi:hypothetical protein